MLIGKLTADFPTDDDDPNNDPQTGEMPEPATAMLGMLGLAGLMTTTGRRR